MTRLQKNEVEKTLMNMQETDVTLWGMIETAKKNKANDKSLNTLRNARTANRNSQRLLAETYNRNF